MDIEGVSVFIFMKFQEHGYIRGYYPREDYCIHIRKIHEYIHGYILIRVSMRTPSNKPPKKWVPGLQHETI